MWLLNCIGSGNLKFSKMERNNVEGLSKLVNEMLEVEFWSVLVWFFNCDVKNMFCLICMVCVVMYISVG